MAEAGDVAAAIERLRSEMLHAPLCPITPCTCQRFADLALLAQAAQAGGGDCVECVAKQFRIDALQESIDGCAKRVAALSGDRARVIEECVKVVEDSQVNFFFQRSPVEIRRIIALTIRALLTPVEERGA